MPPRPQQNERKKSIIVIPSRVVTRPDDLEGGEEIEIAANINVPGDGCWGWVVVTASFCIIFILDGVAFTFGSQLGDISSDLGVDDSLVALINSIAVAIYLIAGPLVSALINRFGFRACTMAGSVICSFSLFTSYFVTNYTSLCVFYGVFAGFGYSLINMSSGLVVGFYFEKLRSVALAIATCGSSCGVMICYPLNSELVSLAGWRSTTLLHSGLFGCIYFLAMAYRPLLALTVVKTTTTDDPTRTVTYLPSLSTATLKSASTKPGPDSLKPSAAERLFSAVSNANFPKAGDVVDDNAVTNQSNQPGPSTAAATTAGVSKLTITAITPKGGMSRRQIKQVQSIMSKSVANVRDDKTATTVEVNVQAEETTKSSCWGRLCHWEQHVTESRPMYRDDAFYTGKIENLPEYHKSRANIPAGQETGLEYQLAVSRAAAASDLREHRGVFTTAVRRVLATMMDPKLLRRRSFLLLCLSGFLTYLGFLVPYVFLQDRNLKAGVDPKHCNLFVSAIGASNAIGRLALGSLAVKINPLKLFAAATFTAGVATVASDMSYDMYYQYVYCVSFGFCIAGVASLRSQVLVNIYGLDKLTNATGMILLFQGLGSLISTPTASILKNKFGYAVAFYVAGIFIALGGLILLPVRSISQKENATVPKRPTTSSGPMKQARPSQNTKEIQPPLQTIKETKSPTKSPKGTKPLSQDIPQTREADGARESPSQNKN